MNRRPPPAPHSVVWKSDNVFEVTSGKSGTVYKVVQDGGELLCTCEGYRQRKTCSHGDAVVEAVERMVKDPKRHTFYRDPHPHDDKGGCDYTFPDGDWCNQPPEAHKEP